MDLSPRNFGGRTLKKEPAPPELLGQLLATGLARIKSRAQDGCVQVSAHLYPRSAIPILHGLGEVLLGNRRRSRQIRDRTPNFQNPIKHPRGDVHALGHLAHKVLALLVERDDVADVAGGHFGVRPMSAQPLMLQ